jgi:glutamate N-acetyltransferase / amino-acid N-acetyltransferase
VRRAPLKIPEFTADRMAKIAPISPLAPAFFPSMPDIEGVRIATAEAGIRYANRTDVLLALFEEGTTVAGVFTRSKCPSAPVDWCKAVLPTGSARALVVNSGNANAFTGSRGWNAARRTVEITAIAVGCGKEEVYLASTGVIGEPLDAGKFEGVLETAAANAAPGRFEEAARAIMTTDTFPKGAAVSVDLGGAEIRLAGIAKGAGMIAPDMATMLSFVFTDAPVSPAVLQHLLGEAVIDTFNAVTVDSDTSTSDTLLVFATGKAAIPTISDLSDPRVPSLAQGLEAVLLDLAKQVARDGEGARKFVTVEVTGATSKEAARRIAMSIANSPLVKTAVAGEDANWGRVVMAVGKAGAEADRDRLAIWFGDIRVAVDGARDPDYDEAATSAYMKKSEILVRVDLGLGQASDRVFTCDLTKEYVAINGDYRS